MHLGGAGQVGAGLDGLAVGADRRAAPYSGEPTPAYFAAMARLPQVASISTAVPYNVVLPARHGPPQALVQTLASPDRALGASADRVKICRAGCSGPRRPATGISPRRGSGNRNMGPAQEDA